MRLVMTLLARDEEDVVDAQVAFHLHAGVDFVVAIDNASSDGTTEILERYERAGVLRLIREPADDMRQDAWVTGMARLAATDHGADWVINSDADEFWWPRGGSLKDVLATVPDRFGVVRGCWRHFLPGPDEGAFFAERMTVRLATPAGPGDKETIFHAHQKVAHRAHAAVEIERGNHNAEAPGLEPLRAWHPIEVMHFSFRSLAQLERKARGGWLRSPGYEATGHRLLLDEAFRSGTLAAHYASFAVDDEALARGLAEGTPRDRHPPARRPARPTRGRRDVRPPGRGATARFPASDRARGRRLRGGGLRARRDRRHRPRRAPRPRARATPRGAGGRAAIGCS